MENGKMNKNGLLQLLIELYIREPKLDIIHNLNNRKKSITVLAHELKTFPPNIAFHINGTETQYGLIDMGLVELHGMVKGSNILKLTKLAKQLIEEGKL